MARFKVVGLDANGAEIGDVLQARSQEEATKIAREKGYLVSEIVKMRKSRRSRNAVSASAPEAGSGVPGSGPAVLQWGLFGPRQSGKSVALSVLKLVGQGAGVEIEVVDQKTLEYFRPLTERLARGDFPPATPPKVPDRLELNIARDTARIQLRLEDFAGELTDPIWQAGPEEFRQRVLAWIKRCDGIVLFIDSMAPDRHYADMIDSLLHTLEKADTRHGSPCRVLAALYTKADRFAHATPEKLCDPVLVGDLLGDHPVYQRLEQQLSRRKDWLVYRHFPCSAVGFEFESVPDKAKRRIMPCGLFEAVQWTLQETERVVAQTHAEIVDDTVKHLEKQEEEPRFGLANYGGLIQQLDEQVCAHRLDEGPEVQRVATLRQDLMRKQVSQRKKVSLCVGLAAMLLAGGLWYQGHNNQMEAYDAYDAEIAALPHDEDAGARWRLYAQRVLSRRWDYFWGVQDRRNAADQRAEADRRVVARQEADRAFAALIERDRKLDSENQSPRRFAAVQEYLHKHKDFTPDMRLERLSQIQEQTRTAREADSRAWQEAAHVRITCAADYGICVKRLKDYAATPTAVHAGDATALAKKLAEQEQADRQLYEELRSLSGKSRGELEELEAAAKRYLGLNKAGVAMKGVVEAYLAELEKLKKPRDVLLTLSDIEIPANFPDRAWTGNPKIQVTVTMGKQSFSTPVRETSSGGNGFSYNSSQTVGPFRVSYREQQSMSVRITVHRTFFKNESAIARPKGKVNVVKHLNRQWNVQRNGATATMTLACSDVLPPPLKAAYGDGPGKGAGIR